MATCRRASEGCHLDNAPSFAFHFLSSVPLLQEDPTVSRPVSSPFQDFVKLLNSLGITWKGQIRPSQTGYLIFASPLTLCKIHLFSLLEKAFLSALLHLSTFVVFSSVENQTLQSSSFGKFWSPESICPGPVSPDVLPQLNKNQTQRKRQESPQESERAGEGASGRSVLTEWEK